MNFIELEAAEFKSKYLSDNSPYLIDVREDYEFEEDNIGGVNIPMGEVLSHINDIKDNSSIYLCCQTGKRSKAIAYHLAQHLVNCNIYSCNGGIVAYKQV